jgi:uncharacterized protein YdaU (DUF1376 family)
MSRDDGGTTPLWMPFYIADHLRKTMHLSAAENGAYLYLIMHYWEHGGLPDDDVRLARIARLTRAQWKAARPTLQAFFHDGWRHKRVDHELAKATDLTMKRKAAGSIGGTRKAENLANDVANDVANEIANGVANEVANAKQTYPQPQPQSQENDDGGGDAGARECARGTSEERAAGGTAPGGTAAGGTAAAEDALALARQIATVAGLGDPKTWPPGWSGAPLRVAAWLGDSWQPEVCLAAVREVMERKRDGPPATIRYFEKAIARAHAQQGAPLPIVAPLPASVAHAALLTGTTSLTGPMEVVDVLPAFGRPGSIAAAGRRSLAELIHRQRLAADQARAPDAGAGEGHALVQLLSAG